MTGTLSSKGQITVPKKIRLALGLKPGDEIVFVAAGGKAEMRPVKHWTVDDLSGLLAEFAQQGEDIRHGHRAALAKSLEQRNKQKQALP
jgi:antitoxin PrlF